jgi:hypothetical protein
MATIQLSTGLKNELASRVWVKQSSLIGVTWGAANGPLVYNTNYGGASGTLYIMKGSVPSNFTGLTLINRTSDILITYETINGDFNSSSYVNNVFTLNTSLVQATGTGTATWFWIYNVGEVNYAVVPVQQIIGNVGTIGSGADLEIQTNSIVAGSPYRVSNLVFVMPDSWTV